ncbi:MAG: hypothetical protein GVY17_00200 [Cyanobacteria bacterium]|jgi:hypothetical protein|nr:hypothetical protein [Cyanobacteria bacterium GSL.Bin21]
MKIKGIKRGKCIELLEDISVEDGTQVSVEIPDSSPDKIAQWKQLESLIGQWKNDEELTAIFAEIDQQRHTDMGREINLDDSL